VTVVSTSTANDQLTRFGLYINTLALVNASGDAVNLISQPIDAEFMHVNGTSEPLFTVSIPQGTYTSATASIEAADFDCATLNPSGVLFLRTFGYEGDALGSNEIVGLPATVGLPAPLTISGPSAALALDLLASKSASWTTCDPSGIEPYSITPTFELTAMTLSSSPSNAQNGLETDLKGVINTFNPANGSFTVIAEDGPGCAGTTAGPDCSPPAAYAPVWQVVSDSGTAFEGATGSSQLTPGMAVNMDAALQPDGSLLAKRIATYDSETSDLTIYDGPVVFTDSLAGYQQILMYPACVLGPPGSPNPQLSYASASFEISGEFTNLGNLPFVPNFTAASAVDGQNIYASTHALTLSIPPIFVPATSITLVPQTINGTVSAMGSEGGFTTYTITLAPYDLFPDLAVQTQAGQTTLLNNPNTLVVYADRNTQMLNTSPIALGSVVRFYGLVFNDNGTLRMDCAQINDGVAE
jgi:hypothetical protein